MTERRAESVSKHCPFAMYVPLLIQILAEKVTVQPLVYILRCSLAHHNVQT